MNAFWDINPHFYPIGKPILFSQIYFKNILKKTFKVLLLKVLYALEIQEAYNRKSFMVHRVGLGHTVALLYVKYCDITLD